MFSVVLFIIFAVIIDNSVSFTLHENSNKLHDLDWQCDTICVGSGGRAQFDPEHKICKCTIDKNTDDIDIELMQKTARDLGLEIITCNKFLDIQKREVNQKGDNEKQLVTIEDRLGANPSKLLSNFDHRSLLRKSTIHDKKPVVASFNKKYPFSKKTGILRESKDKNVNKLTTRVKQAWQESKGKLDRFLEENGAKFLKTRSNFKDTNTYAVLDKARTKQKALVDQFLTRKAKLLDHSAFNKNRNKDFEDASERQEVSEQNLEIKTAQRKVTVPNKSNKGIILQPTNTYNNDSE